MSLLILALLAFGIVHVIPAIPRARNAARQLLGRAYGPVYGTLSFVLLAVAIAAFRHADTSEVYDVPVGGRHANFGLTLVAFVFVGIFIFHGSWRNQVKYPMALATGFWAVGHLMANGDSRSIVFVLGLELAALIHAVLDMRLVGWAPVEERAGHNLLSVLMGVAFYAVMAQLHGAVIGVPVLDIQALGQ